MNKDLAYLLSPQAIRDQAARIHALAEAGKTHFSVHPERLPEVAKLVLDVTLANYPDLRIPFHSRWGHFQAGQNGEKTDRLAELDRQLAAAYPTDAAERVRAKLDLVVVSVLLDAGSGPGWSYRETETGQTVARSEGLAVASLRMFLAGAFSSDPALPLQADAQGLRSLKLETLARGFQVSPGNPLAGLEGRLGLLHSLGDAVSRDARFGGRPGGIHDHFIAKGRELEARDLLLAVLQGLGPIWPGRIQLEGVSLGDVWHHPLLGSPGSVESLVPFHKLSQWLTYSLIEPLEQGGLRVLGVEKLTGLAEYRNGGLMVDSGLIRLRDASLEKQSHRPDSPLVIEWRALTLVLLEKIAAEVRKQLRKSESELPLAKVLEGGTWWAGRKLAAERRSGGGPPLSIQSDGTVF